VVDAQLIGFILKVLAAVAIAFPVLIYLLQERLIFLPQPSSEAERSTAARRYPGVREVFLQASDGTRLHAWHVPAPATAPASVPLVVYFGGNAENVAWMLDELPRRTPAVAWLLVDYRGYGGSAGAPSEAALVADALLWYDQASALSKRIFVFGRSLGTGVAVQLASQREVAGVILVTPFDSLVKVAQRYYPFLPVRWMLRHRFDSAAIASNLRAPLLCLTAMQDEVIPPDHGRRLFEAWGGPKQWVPLEGATHNTTDSRANYWPSIAAFLSSP
jgi:pimeloyl-ACP methyl ester carboxylesterase